MDSFKERDKGLKPPLTIREYVHRLYTENAPSEPMRKSSTRWKTCPPIWVGLKTLYRFGIVRFMSGRALRRH